MARKSNKRSKTRRLKQAVKQHEKMIKKVHFITLDHYRNATKKINKAHKELKELRERS